MTVGAKRRHLATRQPDSTTCPRQSADAFVTLGHLPLSHALASRLSYPHERRCHRRPYALCAMPVCPYALPAYESRICFSEKLFHPDMAQLQQVDITSGTNPRRCLPRCPYASMSGCPPCPHLPATSCHSSTRIPMLLLGWKNATLALPPSATVTVPICCSPAAFRRLASCSMSSE